MRFPVPSAIAAVTALLVSVVGGSRDADPHRFQTSLVDAPSLLLHVTLGNDISIHGQAAFDIFVRPVVSTDKTSVRYDGATTIIEGDKRFTYKLVDGAGYLVTTFGDKKTSAAGKTVACLSNISPFDLILPALNNASVIPTKTHAWKSMKCPSQHLLRSFYRGMDLVLCPVGSSGATGLGTIEWGGQVIDVAVAVEYLPSHIRSLTAPVLGDESAPCSIQILPTSVTPTTLALLTGKVIEPTASIG
ncbi:hypothetical protein ON010_g16456 [Phytophthora cinnamomi]|nr:hypothetical protein ON010_g16456 [Phytophthora cinnamomi]